MSIVDQALASLGYRIRIDRAADQWVAWLIETNSGIVRRALTGAPGSLSAENARILIYTRLAVQLKTDEPIGPPESWSVH
ncbi:MAG: hypothetical protein IPN84_17350 [Sphingomonadales bacterium]|nr:hypothetical protein [Sphingomonadales bacterium]